MTSVIKEIYKILNQGEDIVLASIISSIGSSPRTAGAKMIIRSNGEIIGSIGGGIMEAEVIKAGLKIFDTRQTNTISFDLTNKNMKDVKDSIDMICGGQVNIFLEFLKKDQDNIDLFKKYSQAIEKGKNILCVARLSNEKKHTQRLRRVLIIDDLVSDDIYPTHILETIKQKIRKQRSPIIINLENQQFFVEPGFVQGTVYLLGAGHVSQQLAQLTKMAEFRTTVLDDRAEFANKARFKHADQIIVLDSFDNAFKGLEINHESYVVILTRGHSYDKTVLAQALRTTAGYIGMIGSHRKRDAIYNQLLKDGFSEKDLNRVHSPIGLEIHAQTPEEIAVSIIAQLILIRAQNAEKI